MSIGSGRLRGVRVLVVDADDEARRAAVVALATEDAAVTPVDSVRNAIAFAYLTRPDVIVADLLMEDHGGRRLLETLRKCGAVVAAIPVVATSGGRDRQDGEAALLGGFAAYVAKPFESETLREVLARVAIATALRDPRP
jgi:CheY-like chemotaxis protein